ncbi:MAG: alpha-L-fucosidase [Oscillospiraceae bacterium]
MITLEPSIMPNAAQIAQIERKYGMFIHFGINTFNDTEWSDGTLPLSSYNPTEIDADGWVKNAKDAGMEYVILITKHHDGFCLFDTRYTDYCVNNTSNPTDVVAEVAKSCEKYGLKLGLYYSLWDRNAGFYKKHSQYVEYMCNQLTELLGGKYGEVVEVWFDGGWDKNNRKNWDIPKIYDLVHTLQPNCVMSVNTTIGKDTLKGWNSPKYEPEKYEENMPIRYFPSDFRLWDPHFTGKDDPKIYMYNKKQYYLPFEATICIRNMTNWFWDPKYTDEKLVDTKFIVDKYNHLINQKNLLVVNVAPNIYGKQEQTDIDRLLDVAKELKIGKFAL